MSSKPPRETATALPLGTVLDERYRLDRLLGYGASGEVYAASDLALGGEVAVKVLHTRQMEPDRAIERFKREALLARRISHPNVCRLHDFGVHRSESGEVTLFLTMELLAGETLAQRLERQGRLSEREALGIARQLAEGLAAAHRAGVIHRDFKSSNVMLVPEANGHRAVITDFGLARALTGRDSFLATVTQPGGIVGTPAYMSPEQVEGRAVDERADVYALGVVLYEMLTGELPFEGESPISIAMKRLSERPRPIEEFLPQIHPRTRTLVERCLEREPEDRFPSAEVLRDALAGVTPVPPPRRRRRRLAFASALALAAAASAFLILRLLEWQTPSSRPLRVAVLEIRTLAADGEDSWLGVALAQMLSTELAAPGGLETVPMELVASYSRDLKIETTQDLSLDRAAKFRDLSGADVLVLGSITRDPNPASGKLRLDLRSLDRVGLKFPPIAVDGSRDQLFELATTAGARLRASLGLETRSADPLGPRTRIWGPRSAAAVRTYAEGLSAFGRGELQEARERFEEAVAEDPEFALAWSALARSWGELGYMQKARELSETAYRKSLGLPSPERLEIEGYHRRIHGQWQEALEIYSARLRERPEELERVVTLAEVQLGASRPQEVLATLERGSGGLPRRLRDLRLLLLEVKARLELSQFAEALEVAALLAERARELGARTYEAEAEVERAVALRRLGRSEESRSALERAREIAAAGANPVVEARVLISLGNLERSLGRLDLARVNFEEAARISERLGHIGQLGRAKIGLAQVEAAVGRLGQAIVVYREVLALAAVAGDPASRSVVESNLGSLLAETGEFAEAREWLHRAREAFEAQGRTSRAGYSDLSLAVIALWAANLSDAERLARSAHQAGTRSGDRRLEGLAQGFLGEVELWRGQIPAALETLRRALSILEDSNNAADVPDLKVVILRARFESGERGALVAEMRELLEDLERQQGSDPYPLFELARMLLRAGEALPRLEERAWARSASGHLSYLAAASAGLYRSEAARVSGNSRLAIREAEAVLARARSRGAMLFELQAELDLALARDDAQRVAALIRRGEEMGLRLFERLVDLRAPA